MSFKSIELDSICTFLTGGTPSTNIPDNYTNGEIPWIVSGDIHKREIFDTTKKITQKGMDSSPAKTLPINSVLIALNGQGKTRGTVALLKMPNATCNQSIVSINPKPNKALDHRYLYLTLRSMYQSLRDITGDKKRAGLNIGILKRIKIPLPPLAEQTRIAAILDKADAIRRKQQEAIDLCDQFLKALFIDLFGDPLTNPKGWEVKKLGDCIVGKSQNGFFAKNDQYSDSGEGSPIIWINDFINKFYADTRAKRSIKVTQKDLDKYSVKYGDVLFCRSSLTVEGIGKAAIIPKNVTHDTIYECHIIRLSLSPNKLVPEFFRELSNTFFFRAQIMKRSKTSTMTTIGQEGITNSLVALPPLDLQNKFAEVVKKTYAKKAKLQKSLERLDDSVNALSQQAFKGEL